MLGLIGGIVAREIIKYVVIGIFVGAFTFTVEKMITKEDIIELSVKILNEKVLKSSASEKNEQSDFMNDGLKALVKENGGNHVKISILDSMDHPVADMSIEGPCVDDSIKKGDCIAIVV